MKGHFYNTINLFGSELETERAKNIKQEDMLLRIFQANPDKRFGPSELHKLVCRVYNINPPITSTHRALTDLTDQELLIKTSYMVKGLYHLSEHTWTLKTNNG